MPFTSKAKAKSTSQEWKVQIQDLRHTSIFYPASISDIHKDEEVMRKRLEDLANVHFGSKPSSLFLPGRVPQNHSLAKYLLLKLRRTSHRSRMKTLDISNAMLWMMETESSEAWRHDEFLGSGSCGSVLSTKWFGISCAKKLFQGNGSEQLFLKEAGILAHLKHPRIVNFFCCGNGQKKGHRFIVMELMESSLSSVIEDRGDLHFTLLAAVDIMVQMARAMCYLHGEGIAHRDLKPHNVVVTRSTSPPLVDSFDVKLVDFGMSKARVEEFKAYAMSGLGIGTTLYRAPEIHPKAHPEGGGKAIWFTADVYSFAITCAHVLSLKTPFVDHPFFGFYEELMNGLRPELPANCPEELSVLIRDCWNTNQSLRPSFTQICTRRETFRHKLLRGISSLDQGSQEEIVGSTSYEFIKRMLEEQSLVQESFVANADGEIDVIDLDKYSSIPSQFVDNIEDEVVATVLKRAEVDTIMKMSKSSAKAKRRVLIDSKPTSNERFHEILSELKQPESIIEVRRKRILTDGMLARTIIPQFPNWRVEEKCRNLEVMIESVSVDVGKLGWGNISESFLRMYDGSHRSLAGWKFHPPSSYHRPWNEPWKRFYSSATWTSNTMKKLDSSPLLPPPHTPSRFSHLSRFFMGCSLLASAFAPELQFPTNEQAIQYL